MKLAAVHKHTGNKTVVWSRFKKSAFPQECWHISVSFFHFLFKPGDQDDILIPLPLSALLRFLGDSLILCPSYGPEYHPIL